jgi:predicted O-methyltransferase YrrM
MSSSLSIGDRLAAKINQWRGQQQPNLRGTQFAAPGHFYSPLLDIESASETGIPHDDESLWENVDLRENDQRAFYTQLLSRPDLISFPASNTEGFRYYHQNGWFPELDGVVLSHLIQKLKPAHYLEIGSGYSTAAVLDTLEHHQGKTQITLVEPDLSRLRQLLRPQDEERVTVHTSPVQELPLSTFETLGENDILFIDSSHVAKIGSDVSWLFLRVLPRLRRGVWVHIHDIFYPESYPLDWVQEGRAWNESLFLRAFLVGNPAFQVRAFHAFARHRFENEVWSAKPELRASTGSGFWMQKIS